ncbi:ABC transporter ATP-binding protein [Sorangium sp. So ce295]|uniref:ABC transporter ATP-binding protein n=1 Tax=Sorangium sp. So ce295 TaxID=3133295 RepID=UPI003F6029DB
MTSGTTPLAVELRDLRHDFVLGDGRRVPALRLESLEIAAGERLVVRGPNGSGKTTLLHVIAGLLRPQEGRVYVDGVDLFGLSEAARDRFRARRIGYLFQTFCLLEPLSALENVLCAASFGGVGSRRAQRERAEAMLIRFGLAQRLHHRPSQLSTGEQQRVAAARALVNDPAVVLCDEPTASLDPRGSRRLLRELDKHCEEHDATLIVVSHDQEALPPSRSLALGRKTRSA